MRDSRPLPERLLSLLRAEGPQSPGRVIERLGTSQPSLFRAVRSEPSLLAALGAARNRKLAAIRQVRSLDPVIPVFTVSPEGEAVPTGRILAFHPSAYAFQLDDAPSKPRHYATLPAFLRDACPRGFQGSLLARQAPDLGLPASSESWSPDDMLEMIAKRGEDLPGNLLVGAESFARQQRAHREPAAAIPSGQIGERYAALARAAEEGELTGPLVGGASAKFCAFAEGPNGLARHVIVKFSPAGDTFAARRIRDLLIAEAVALETLTDHQIQGAEARVLEAGGRIFLEVIRFDRAGRSGRRRVLSPFALGGTWTKATNWSSCAGHLAHERRISPEELRLVQRLECFARLIANDDRGPDNLSFQLHAGHPFATLAPIYDMQPAFYAPAGPGGSAGQEFALPSYDHTLHAAWKSAIPAATDYWERVCGHPKISGDFSRIAAKNLDRVRKG